VRLPGLDGQSLVHHRAEGQVVDQANVGAGDGELPALAAGADHLPEDVGPVGAQLHGHLGLVEHGVDAAAAVGFGAHRVDAAVGAASAGHVHELVVHVDVFEVDGFGLASARGHRQALGNA